MDYPKGLRARGRAIEIRLQFKGKTYNRRIPTNTPNAKRTIAQAVQIREEMLSRLRLGLPILKDEHTSIILKDIAQDYLESLDLEHASVETYVYALNRYWLPAYGNWLINEIKPSDIKRYLNSYEKSNGEGISAKTKRNVLCALSNIYTHAIGDGLVDNNPCKGLKFKRDQTLEVHPFSPKERSAILNLLEGDIYVYFVVLFETGMRPGEVFALLWTDYDGETLTVNKSIVRKRLKNSTKTHENRKVIVSELLRKTLDEFKKGDHGLNIFETPEGGPFLRSDYFNEAWTEALNKAGIPYRIPYNCRHTRASILLANGVDPAYAADQLGHSPEMFFRKYARLIDSLKNQTQLDKIKKIEW